MDAMKSGKVRLLNRCARLVLLEETTTFTFKLVELSEVDINPVPGKDRF
jgi:hypothetical protein